MRRRGLLPCLLIGLAALSVCQEVQFQGPIAGLIFDPPSRSLRQVLGVPGAARLGPPVFSDLEWASVAPNGRLALLVSQGELQLIFNGKSQGAITRTASEATKNLPSLSFWAEDSRSVLLYWAETRTFERLRIENERAVSSDGPVVLSGVEGDVTALAGDNTGAIVIAAIAGAGLYRVSPAGETHLILSIADGSAFSLDSNGQTLWLVDRASAALVSVTNLGGSKPDVRAEIVDPERLNDVIAVRWSSDQKILYLVSGSTPRLYTFDRVAAAIGAGIELDSVATRLQPLGRSSLLLSLRSKLDDPLYLLDEKAGLSVFFVPPGDER